MIDPFHAEAPERIDRACRANGFFRLPADVIDRAVADRAWDAAGALFDLDASEHDDITFPEPGYPYGFSPFGLERLASSLGEATPPDLKASFSVGPDCLGPVSGTRPEEAWIRSPSRWPAALPDLRPAWEAVFRAQSVLCEHLLGLMAVALDLPADHFETSIDRPISAMRALDYPALDDQPPPGSLRAGAHTDYGTLTILRTDEVPGLEIRDARGTWVGIDPEPDTFIVNLGDSIAQWTNDRWRSTLHRVVPGDGRRRRSMAFFHMANWDARIEPLPTCVSDDDPPRHDPVLAGPWLMEKFQATVSSG